MVFFNDQAELGEVGSLYVSATMSGAGNKRAAGEPGPSAPPEKKAGVEDLGTTVETIKLGGVSSTVCLFCLLPLKLLVFLIWEPNCLSSLMSLVNWFVRNVPLNLCFCTGGVGHSDLTDQEPETSRDA